MPVKKIKNVEVFVENNMASQPVSKVSRKTRGQTTASIHDIVAVVEQTKPSPSGKHKLKETSLLERSAKKETAKSETEKAAKESAILAVQPRKRGRPKKVEQSGIQQIDLLKAIPSKNRPKNTEKQERKKKLDEHKEQIQIEEEKPKRARRFDTPLQWPNGSKITIAQGRGVMVEIGRVVRDKENTKLWNAIKLKDGAYFTVGQFAEWSGALAALPEDSIDIEPSVIEKFEKRKGRKRKTQH